MKTLISAVALATILSTPALACKTPIKPIGICGVDANCPVPGKPKVVKPWNRNK